MSSSQTPESVAALTTGAPGPLGCSGRAVDTHSDKLTGKEIYESIGALES